MNPPRSLPLRILGVFVRKRGRSWPVGAQIWYKYLYREASGRCAQSSRAAGGSRLPWHPEVRDASVVCKEKTLDKTLEKLTKLTGNTPCRPRAAENGKVSVRRVFHHMECRYLSQEARSMASCLMDSQSVPPEVTERAIQQALVLGVMSGTAIDVSTFESLFDAVVLDPKFKIPFVVPVSLPPSGAWVC